MTVEIKYMGEPGSFDEEQLTTFNELQMLAFGARHVKAHLNHWWLASDRRTGQPAGFCTLYQYPQRPTTGFLSLAAVVQEFRGHGLQRRMIRERMKKAKELGIIRVISYTSPDNVHSANNLFSCGFKLYVPDYEWGIEHGLYFRKFV